MGEYSSSMEPEPMDVERMKTVLATAIDKAVRTDELFHGTLKHDINYHDFPGGVAGASQFESAMRDGLRSLRKAERLLQMQRRVV